AGSQRNRTPALRAIRAEVGQAGKPIRGNREFAGDFQAPALERPARAGEWESQEKRTSSEGRETEKRRWRGGVVSCESPGRRNRNSDMGRARRTRKRTHPTGIMESAEGRTHAAHALQAGTRGSQGNRSSF